MHGLTPLPNPPREGERVRLCLGHDGTTNAVGTARLAGELGRGEAAR